MQISALASPVPTAATAVQPAAGRIQSMLSPDDRAAMPVEMLETRVGRGTLASELDRSIRVRFEGTGPVSGRDIVAETTAAAKLLAGPGGDTFRETVRAFASVADAHQGVENLKSVTFVPDEHAAKAAKILNQVSAIHHDGVDTKKELTTVPPGLLAKLRKENPGVPLDLLKDAIVRAQNRDLVLDWAKDEPSHVRFSAAYNLDGHVTVMPDVARELFASVGLYRIQPGDQATKLPLARRDLAVKEAWRTMVHETYHSVNPLPNSFNDNEVARVMEEAISTVLERSQGQRAWLRAGVDPDSIERPARHQNGMAVDWAPWNRAHLPAPPKDLADTAKGRYDTGPKLVRAMLGHAGLDLRTAEGRSAMLKILETGDAAGLPLRLAQAVAAKQGLDAAATKSLATLVEQVSVGTAPRAAIDRLVAGAKAGR